MEAILVVLPEAERLPSLLDAMKQAGVPGATVLDSQGLEFLAWFGAHPAMGRYWSLEGADRQTSKTILSIVPEEIAERVMVAIEESLGGFQAPNSGMLCSWKIGHFRCYLGDKPTIGRAEVRA